MSACSGALLLKFAFPLVRTHGFTREALARSVLNLPPAETGGRAHTEPLSDTAISALFGRGDEARRTLIIAWLKNGLRHMGSIPGVEQRRRILGEETVVDSGRQDEVIKKATLKNVLRARLEYNEPVLVHLPEAFALLLSPSSGVSPLDLGPALEHAARVADTACFVTGDKSLQLEWYAQRASLAAAYTAAELHQLVSPTTAYSFLDSLLDSSSKLKSSIDDVTLYSSYILKSWKGILQSSGIV